MKTFLKYKDLKIHKNMRVFVKTILKKLEQFLMFSIV